MNLRVLSFDFDGCLFHSKYVQTPKKDVIEANKLFFEKIKSENHLYFKSITFIGSNRQSKSVDYHNSWDKGSCFPAIKQIADFLEIELDPFLLADLYADIMPGTSYERAITRYHEEEHEEWMFDESKITIIYAQMHKVAQAYPSAPIIFEFFDDRKDVLEGINDFFSANQEIIPPNLTLKLNYYKGDDTALHFTLSGNEKSFIDEEYCQTIKNMALQIGAEYHKNNNFALEVDLSLLPKKTSGASILETPLTTTLSEVIVPETQLTSEKISEVYMKESACAFFNEKSSISSQDRVCEEIQGELYGGLN